jgi:hypothetical protein
MGYRRYPTMSDTPKTRGQMAIKSRRLTPEWQARVKKAAERAGMGIGDFIVEASDARALAILKNQPEEGIPAGTPPARLEDVVDRIAVLADAVAQLAQGQETIRDRLPDPTPAPASAETALDVRREIRRAFRTGARRRR